MQPDLVLFIPIDIGGHRIGRISHENFEIAFFLQKVILDRNIKIGPFAFETEFHRIAHALLEGDLRVITEMKIVILRKAIESILNIGI